MLIVAGLDRLARSVAHLCELVHSLEAKKVMLRVLDIGLDTSTTTGRLMLNLLGSIAQFVARSCSSGSEPASPRRRRRAVTGAGNRRRCGRPVRSDGYGSKGFSPLTLLDAWV